MKLARHQGKPLQKVTQRFGRRRFAPPRLCCHSKKGPQPQNVGKEISKLMPWNLSEEELEQRHLSQRLITRNISLHHGVDRDQWFKVSEDKLFRKPEKCNIAIESSASNLRHGRRSASICHSTALPHRHRPKVAPRRLKLQPFLIQAQNTRRVICKFAVR